MKSVPLNESQQSFSAPHDDSPSWDHPSLCPPADGEVPLGFLQRLGVLLEMIKFRHSVFALPFALIAMLVAADGLPHPLVFFWIVLACVSARSMAMAYNRLVDRDLDATNPRTSGRALPAGLLSVRFAWAFFLFNMALFLLCSAMLNPLCLKMAPLMLIVLLGYSHAKRMTKGVHFILGVALALAPIGAWVAVTGSLVGLPLFLALGVVFWTTGLDLIYSCVDVEHDRREDLYSIPARHSIRVALRLASVLHFFCILCFALWVWEMQLGQWSMLALGLSAILLFLESRVVRPDDLSRVGPAFFSYNAAVSILLLCGVVADIFLGSLNG